MVVNYRDQSQARVWMQARGWQAVLGTGLPWLRGAEGTKEYRKRRRWKKRIHYKNKRGHLYKAKSAPL